MLSVCKKKIGECQSFFIKVTSRYLYCVRKVLSVTIINSLLMLTYYKLSNKIYKVEEENEKD